MSLKLPSSDDRYYIGRNKPKIDHIYIRPVGQFEDSDNAPNDPEQNWDEDLHSEPKDIKPNDR